MTEERALSESIGFLFVFAAIVMMASIVYATGFADLQDTRDFEQANNAERAFGILASNMEDVSHGGAPSRATEVQLDDDAEMYTGDSVYADIYVVDQDDPDNNDSVHADIEPLVYESGDHKIVYANGAIFRSSGDSETMVREPGFSISEDRVVLPMIRTYVPGDDRKIALGSDTVLVRGLNEHTHGIPYVAQPPADAESYDISIVMHTERAELWESYFTEQDGIDEDDCEVDDGVLECELTDVDQVQASSVSVSLVFE